jgi:hypothetical protein
MPLLAGNTTEEFGLSVSGTGTVSWVISCISQLSAGGDVLIESKRGLTAQGQVYQPSILAIPSSFTQATHGVATRELQFFSAVNQGTSSNVVTLGKIVTVTLIGTTTFTSTATNFFQFSPPSTLQPQESLIYVKDSGFQVYDAQGLKKVEGDGTSCMSTGTTTYPSPVAAQSYQAAGQTIPSSTNTPVTFDTLNFASPSSMYSTATPTRLTAPQAGLYRAVANVIFSTAGSNALASMWLQVNGGTATHYAVSEGHISSIAGANTNYLSEFLFNLNAGDYVEAWVTQNNGSGLALNDDTGPATCFSLSLVR